MNLFKKHAELMALYSGKVKPIFNQSNDISVIFTKNEVKLYYDKKNNVYYNKILGGDDENMEKQDKKKYKCPTKKYPNVFRNYSDIMSLYGGKVIPMLNQLNDINSVISKHNIGMYLRKEKNIYYNNIYGGDKETSETDEKNIKQIIIF